MNRLEVLQFLKAFFAQAGNSEPDTNAAAAAAALNPFLDMVSSLKQSLPPAISLLREFAAIRNSPELTNSNSPILYGRINRRYARLRRTQEELGRLNFRKAAPGVSPEDYVFSQIDFSRYRELGGKDFNAFFLEGLADFDSAFYKKNFNLERREIRSLIEGSYEQSEGVYRIRNETPLVLSVMRTLDTSLESKSLISAAETASELESLLRFLAGKDMRIPGTETLFPFLVCRLDGLTAAHEDGMITKLFVPEQGGLCATFRPGGKPWTVALVPGAGKETASSAASRTPAAW